MNTVDENMRNMPLVSVGIPVYNVEEYIEKCIYSVLNQTYQQIEILAVDDLGNDKSMHIIADIQKSHPSGNKIKIIRQPQNGGSGEARNSAIHQAQGKYLYFLDSDDYIEENTIEMMVEQAEKYHTDVVIASLRKVVWGTGEEQPTLQYPRYLLIQGKDEFAKYVCQDLRWHIAITACNILFNVTYLRDNDLYFAASKDEDALYLSEYYSEVESAVILPDVTYNYVMRPGSKMGNNARKVIPVNEIRDRFITDAIMTERCLRLKNRSFYDVHCARVVKHKFRAVCVALRHRSHFSERLTNTEIRNELKHPATFSEIIRFRRYKLFHLTFFTVSKLPSLLSVSCCYVLGKAMRWI